MLNRRRIKRTLLSLVVTALVLTQGTLTAAAQQAPPQQPPFLGEQTCAGTSIGQVPLTELGSGTYAGYVGGLYPDGLNDPPASYLALGLRQAQQVTPLNAAGQPDPGGSIGLVALGMSNVEAEFAAFQSLVAQDTAKNQHLVFVNGSFGGMDTTWVLDPKKHYWDLVGGRLGAAGLQNAQVQVAWLKEAIRNPTGGFPSETLALHDGLNTIISQAEQQFPNLRLLYVSSRIYAGYALTSLNPEPYAYESGFAVQWVMKDQIAQAGSQQQPWVGWGPYMWADGTNARADGLSWACGDFGHDGMHPGPPAQAKVANLLYNFFVSDPTAQSWFVQPGVTAQQRAITATVPPGQPQPNPSVRPGVPVVPVPQPPVPAPQPPAAPAPQPVAPAPQPAVPAPQLQPAPATVSSGTRLFDATGFSIDDDAFWDYFQHLGGVRTLGYPISRKFQLLGFPVQMFQRSLMQKLPDGSVTLMNLLDPGLMPYFMINNSILPPLTPGVVTATPAVDDPDYAQKIIDFVHTQAPDQFQGEPVGFSTTFDSTVAYDELFPDGSGPASLVPLFDLQIWGAPTGKPLRDPRNPNFIYQRFQRGIMHYDKSCACTNGLLLADYFKSILTGQNLPADLADEARNSRFYLQYAPGSPGAVARPTQLPDTDMTDAFAPVG